MHEPTDGTPNDYSDRPTLTVRDLILTLGMFDPDTEVVVDDILGCGALVPPVLELVSGPGPDMLFIRTPSEAQASDAPSRSIE